jgi:hypothetical protein
VSRIGTSLYLVQVGEEILALIDRVEASRGQQIAFGSNYFEVALALTQQLRWSRLLICRPR